MKIMIACCGVAATPPTDGGNWCHHELVNFLSRNSLQCCFLLHWSGANNRLQTSVLCSPQKVLSIVANHMLAAANGPVSLGRARLAACTAARKELVCLLLLLALWILKNLWVQQDTCAPTYAPNLRPRHEVLLLGGSMW